MKSIGVDVIEIQRIEEALNRHGERFWQRVFTSQERLYCAGRTHSMAARWAAKEAAAKAMGLGIGKVAFKEIEVVADDHQCPSLVLHGEAKMMARRLGWRQWHLSLSHSRDFAIALVIVE